MITKRKITQSLDNPDSKRALNKDLFTLVARKYGSVTKLLSFGFDDIWKKALVQQLPPINAPQCIDLACGTGDICALLAERYPEGHIMGVDITPAMLAVAVDKNNAKNISYIQADMTKPPVADGTIDIVTGGYALRNAPNLDEVLQTVWNKLKPGGVATFLDFSKSDELNEQRWQIRLLTFWTGVCSLIIHANPVIHNYIPESLKAFPTRKALQERIERLGFVHYTCRYYSQGFIAEISFMKPNLFNHVP